jgi:hypothetical protein
MNSDSNTTTLPREVNPQNKHLQKADEQADIED